MNQILKYSILLTIAVLFTSIGFTQKIEEITHREVNVHFNDSSIKASILIEDKKVKPKNAIHYYWYYNNSIKVNQGGYKGRLLDGTYQVVNKDGSLLTNGTLKKGYQTGEWKHWENNGDLRAVYNWRKGHENGSYQKFNEGKVIEEGHCINGKISGSYRKYENEKLIEKGSYKNGNLHGKVITYKDDTIFREVAYKKGKEVIKKDKKPKDETKEEEVKKEDGKTKKKWQFWKKNEEKVESKKGNKSKEYPAKKDKKEKTKKLKKEKKKKDLKTKKDD